MSNFLRRGYQKFEQAVESDRYSTTQRVLAASALLGVMIGGVKAAEHFELDEAVMNSITSIAGNDEPMDHED